ncbi:MAG: hypothetical protein ABW185_26945 [Sedimenticola sp.]
MEDWCCFTLRDFDILALHLIIYVTGRKATANLIGRGTSTALTPPSCHQ